MLTAFDLIAENVDEDDLCSLDRTEGYIAYMYAVASGYDDRESIGDVSGGLWL